MPSSRPALWTLLAFSFPAIAPALVVLDGTQSTLAPADDFGFANVARVFDSADGFFASGVYLGSGWMLSAYHVVRDGAGAGFSFGSVQLGDNSYTVAPGSAVRLRNADNSFADVALFQLTTVPAGLPSLTISATTPGNNSPVVLAGNGFDRETVETHWNVDTATTPDTWTETAGTGARQGYYLTYNQAVRWGTNALSNFGNPSLTTGSVNDGFGVSTTVKTLFTAGVSGEAQAAPGDSGGGLFYKRGSGWELLGILITTSRFDGQPSAIFPSAIPKDSAVYGNETFAVNLPTYRSQIVATIPEPASVALLGAGACLLGIRRRRPGNL